MAKVEYPLDDTGSAATNRTLTELHTVSYNAEADYHFVIPDYAPFYADSVQILRRIGSSRIPLKEGVDFHFGLEYTTATIATGKPLYAAIVFTNVSETSLYELQPYQTLGGGQVLDEQKTAELIANIVYNPQSLTWEQVQEKPEIFPPVQHVWAFNDMVGQSEVVEAIMQVANVIASKASAGGDHPFLKGNPHDTSKWDLDLGKVQNYGMADIGMMLSGTNNEAYTSPALVYRLLDNLGLLDIGETLEAMKTHMANKENPHETTKDLIGLGLVSNLPVASDQDVTRNRDIDAYLTLRGLRLWYSLHGASNQISTKEPIKQGALLSTYCNIHYDRIGIYADGRGGTYDSIVTPKDVTCGYQTSVPVAHPPKGDILSQYCSGPHLMSLIANGTGGVTSTVTETNSTKCSGGDFPPKGSIIGSVCEGKTLVRTIADGNGGTTIERVENSSQCAVNTNPEKGTLLNFACVGFTMMGYYADGDGGQYQAVLKANDPDCGYTPPVTPTDQTHIPAGTLVGNECDKTTLYNLYANGSGGTYRTIAETNSRQCGYVPPAPGPSPTPSPSPTPAPADRVGTILFSTTHRQIWIGDTEVQTTKLQGWTPGKSYTIEIWGTSVAWGQPYDRMLDTFRITCDTGGNGEYKRTITEIGAVPVGRYNSWMQEASTKVSSNTIERVFMGPR